MGVIQPTAFGIGGDPAALLAAVVARGTSGQGSLVALRPVFRWVSFQLLVAATAGGAGATLDVYVQQSLDGTNFDDIAHFAQVTGATGAQAQSASLPAGKLESVGELHTWRDGTLAAGSVADFVLGRRFRARWVIAGAGASFTFGVAAYPRDYLREREGER